MVKDIWHTADEMPPEDSYVVVKLHSGKCEVGFEFEYDFDNIEKWAFFDDLLACEQELIRTRKALEIAVDALKDCEKILKADRKDWGYLTAKVALNQIEALAEITALEQKE